ncbi:MAG: DMT family transporter [Candidatus Cloacimonadales bacterium]
MSNKTKAVGFMLISALAFAITQAFVKLSGDLPATEKVFFRNLVSLVIAGLICLKNGSALLGKPEHRKFLLYRSVLGAIGMVLYFYAISHLILADAAMLNKLSPFFVTIFAVIFLREKLSRWQIPALILIFGAAMLIVKPRFDLSVLPAVAGLGSALLAGAAYTLVRFLGNKERPETIIFFFSLVTTSLMAISLLGTFVQPTFRQFIYLLGTGISAAIGQFGLTYAYRLAPANEVSIYNYSSILFAALLGFLLWQELPDLYSILGGVLIIAVSAGTFYLNRKWLDNCR